jgi:hypothetical protein
MNATKPAWAVGSHVVTIRREATQWMARDSKGTWRTYGAYKPLATALEVAQWLYHADEIESAEWQGDSVVARIFTAWETEAEPQ